MSLNKYSPQNHLPVSDLSTIIEAFMLRCQSQGLSSGTIQFYQVKFSKFKAFCNNENISDITQLTSYGIRKFLLYLKESGHNPGGISCFYRALRTLLNWYDYEFEPIEWSNPIEKIKAPRVHQNPLEAISLESINKLLDTCLDISFTDFRDRAIILSLLDTGLRASELLDLNIEDINLKTGHCQINSGKGGKFRVAILGDDSIQALKSCLDIRPECDTPAVWITQSNHKTTRLKYAGLRSMIRRRSHKAGIDPPALHSFRRAFAMTLLREEVDIYTLAKLMGHASIDTLKCYLKHTTNDIEIAHKKYGPVDHALYRTKHNISTEHIPEKRSLVHEKC